MTQSAPTHSPSKIRLAADSIDTEHHHEITNTPQATSINNGQNVSYSFRDLLKNELFHSRIIMIFITVLIMILCILYAIGQVLILTLDAYWCQRKDLEVIRKHSRENGYQRGNADGCWSSKQVTV